MNRIFLSLLALICFTNTQAARITEAPQPLSPYEHRVGEQIPDLSFTDLEGKSGKLSDYQSLKATIIALNKIDCPISKKYSPTLIALQKQLAARGVEIVFVNVGKHSLEELKAGTEKLGITGRYIPDLDGLISRSLAAQSSGEVFLLDAARTLRYRGPVDDQYGLTYTLPAPRNHYLVDAIDEVLARHPVSQPAFAAPGCALGLEPASLQTPLTYHARISRIVQNKCQSCHRPGQATPFALMTYADVVDQADMIDYAIEEKLMPPWFADPKHGKFSNDLSLTESEKKDFLQWLRTGMPQGELKDAPAEIAWPEGWTIGTPDKIFEVPTSFEVPASGVVPYQYILLETGQTEDKWVQSIEFGVDHPEVVHHIVVLTNTEDQKEQEQEQEQNALNGVFAAMVPGHTKTVFPKGMAKKLLKGSKLLLQIHYSPSGVAVKERPRVAIQYGPQPLHELKGASAWTKDFVIPAKHPNYEVKGMYEVKTPITIRSLFPHMHLRGKAFRIEAVYPDGKREILLEVPKYSFNWQLTYDLLKPKYLPAGSRIESTGWFDNSAGNPANPNPNVDVAFGEQTTDEMMIGYFDYY